MDEHQKMNTPIQCSEFERLVVFYACDELQPAEREAVEQHAATCGACAASLASEKQLIAALAAQQPAEPSAVLLAQCRGELADKLDEISPAAASFAGRVKAWLRPEAWTAVRPAWSAALFVLLGITLGITLPRWLASPDAQLAGMPGASSVVVRPPSDFSSRDLRTVDRIYFVPGAGAVQPGVAMSFRGEQPRMVSGSLDDDDVRRALISVMQDNLLFDSGLRLDSMDALRVRRDDVDVRGAFCRAARNDRNPGVRLKALEALRGLEQEEQVRQTLLDALLHDDNPGVRIEAINALRSAAANQPDAQLLKVLRDRMKNDPNAYIRLQSAAAVRQIGASGQF
jgi:hypothetical protein